MDTWHSELAAYLPSHYQSSYRVADEILPGMWLGNECAPSDTEFIRARGIRAVISMAKEQDWTHVLGRYEEPIAYYRYPLTDNANLGDDKLITDAFEHAAGLIRMHVARGDSVLVHCQMGISRSMSAVLWYMLDNDTTLTYATALTHVRTKRPIVQPNVHFERLLRQHERERRKEF